MNRTTAKRRSTTIHNFTTAGKLQPVTMTDIIFNYGRLVKPYGSM